MSTTTESGLPSLAQLLPPEPDDLPGLAARLREAADRFSDADLIGISDALLLTAEQLDALQDGEGDEAGGRYRQLSLALQQLAAGDSAALPRTLEDPAWPQPLSADEAGFLRETLAAELPRITPRSLAANTDSATPCAVKAGILALAGDEITPEQLAALAEQAAEAEMLGLADVLYLAAELISEGGQPGALSRLAAALRGWLETPGDETRAALGEALTDKHWTQPPAEEDVALTLELLAADGELLQSGTPLAGEESTEITAEAFPPPDPALLNRCAEEPPRCDPEVVSLLARSLGQYRSQWQDQDAGISPDLRDQLDHFCRALETAQLHGARYALNGILANWPKPDASTERLPVRLALDALLALLGNPTDPALQQALLEACDALPLPPDDSRRAALESLLRTTRLAEPEGPRRRTVTPELLSLKPEKQLEGQLRQMLAAELPELAGQLARLLEQASPEATAEARRIAHTLKGLANMAGITGLATLTHAMEDLLDLLAEAGCPPGAAPGADLLAAADCVAAQCDAVLGTGPAPTEAGETLQRLYDWHYRARTQGTAAILAMSDAESPSGQTPPAPDTAQVRRPAMVLEPDPPPTLPAEEPAAEPEPEQMLSVPQSLLDNLLRLAGEAAALDAQQQESLGLLRRLSRARRERQRKLEQILAELDQQLVQISAHQLLHGDEEQDDSFDALELDRYNRLHSTLSRLQEAAADIGEMHRQQDDQLRRFGELHASLNSVHKESFALVREARLVPFGSLRSRLERILRQACRTAGKEARLVMEGEQVALDSHLLKELTEPLLHLIRNAVDHGLEAPRLRLERGKPECGTITLSVTLQGNRVRVRVHDDGAGIDPEQIRSAAVARGILSADARPDARTLLQLILQPGFSTRSEVTQLSGRGVGMDVVNRRVQALHGHLEIDSHPGAGTTFELDLPATTTLIRALLVRCGDQVLALTTDSIEQTLLSIDGHFGSEGGERWFETDGERLPARRLEELSGHAVTEAEPGRIHPVLIVRISRRERVAVEVSEILAHRELIFRDMGALVPPRPGIPGITILASGEVAPIVDPAARWRHLAQRPLGVGSPRLAPAPDLPRIMVVDDSISARKSLQVLLQDMGYEVITAIDGIDALGKIRQRRPDLVLTDYETPRMNGVELTASLRLDDTLSDLPVIMITSRSTHKHREEAHRAGVSHYLTKPWNETELLTLVGQLVRKEARKTETA